MTLPRVFVAAAAVVLLLAGCAPTAEVASSPTATPESTASPSPQLPVPTSVVLSLDALTVRDAEGAPLESASFSDGAAMLALLSEVLGSTPLPVDKRQHGMWYEWPGVTLITDSGAGRVWLDIADLSGLPVSTSQGVHVGSARIDVEALGPFDIYYDHDGDGVADSFGLEARDVPGTEALGFPGQVGTAYIAAIIEDDVVVRLLSPSKNSSDD